MDAMELRPLSTGEILDRTFTLYRQNFIFSWVFPRFLTCWCSF